MRLQHAQHAQHACGIMRTLCSHVQLLQDLSGYSQNAWKHAHSNWDTSGSIQKIGYPEIRKSEYPDFRISGNAGIRKSGQFAQYSGDLGNPSKLLFLLNCVIFRFRHQKCAHFLSGPCSRTSGQKPQHVHFVYDSLLVNPVNFGQCLAVGEGALVADLIMAWKTRQGGCDGSRLDRSCLRIRDVAALNT